MTLITLNTIVNVYKEPDTNGFKKIIKRNIKCKKTFESNQVLLEQYIKPNGDISKYWCNLKEGENYYTIAHSFEYVENLIKPTYIKGYKRW